MRVDLSLELLIPTLRHAISIVNEKALLPEYKFLTLLAHKGRLFAFARSEVFTYQADLGACNHDFNIAFNPRALQAIINKKTHHRASIIAGESEVVFTSGDVTCHTPREKAYVSEEDLNFDLAPNTAPISSLFDYALACLQNIIGRPDLSHAKFIFGEENITTLSLSTNQLVIYTCQNRTALRKKSISVSLDFANFARKYSDDNPYFEITTNSVILESSNWRIIAPRINLKTPNYQNAIPQGEATIIFADLPKLREMLKTLAKAKAVGVTLEGFSGCLNFQGLNAQGHVVYSVTVTWEFGGLKKPIKYGLDVKLFQNLIKPVKGGQLEIFIKGALDACIVRSSSDPGYYASNMPMRL